MPGNMVKTGWNTWLFTKRAVQEAHKFGSLPTVNQELAGPRSTKVRKTRPGPG